MKEIEALVGGKCERISVWRGHDIFVNRDRVALGLPVNEEIGRMVSWLKGRIAGDAVRLLANMWIDK
jgi:hypothetical protein